MRTETAEIRLETQEAYYKLFMKLIKLNLKRRKELIKVIKENTKQIRRR